MLICYRTRTILDDFREAYYWLRQNTDDDARVMSWWDYGYQIAGMGNRTTLVDNNTWNNSHIAMVRQIVKNFTILLTLGVTNDKFPRCTQIGVIHKGALKNQTILPRMKAFLTVMRQRFACVNTIHIWAIIADFA